MTTFQELNLSEPILKAINKLGFEEATPIQAQTIPIALAGRDLIGQAPTGTGKTVAFAIPMMENLVPTDYVTQGIVVTPTRELAVQVSEEINKIGSFHRINCLPIYGGQDIRRQIKALARKPQIIVGTPGRIMDHMRRRTIRLNSIKMVVLDEADEMLNMGFLEDIETILQEVPKERHTMLFSATMPRQIQTLAQRFMINPELVRVAPKEVTLANTDQHYVEVPENKKFDTLCNLLDLHSPTSAIVFGRTKRRVDELTEALNKRGYSAEGIHGDLTQGKRDSVMNQFRSGIVEILVATDVAARGLDISGVTHVYNFDIPQDPEGYIHRIGRTGRAGRSGEAITFITPREMPHLKLIERLTKRKIQRLPAPSLNEALAGQKQVAIERLLRAAEEESSSLYRSMAEGLLDQNDSVSLLSAALKLLTKEPNTTPVRLTEERPVGTNRQRSDHNSRSNSNNRSTSSKDWHQSKKAFRGSRPRNKWNSSKNNSN